MFVFGNERLSKSVNTVRSLTRSGQTRCHGSVVVLNRPFGSTGGAPSVPQETAALCHAERRPGHRTAGAGRRQEEVQLQDADGTNARLLLLLRRTAEPGHLADPEAGSRGR